MGAATHTPDPSGGAPLLRPDACIACPVLHRSHVILPKHVSKNAPKGRLLSESEWRGLGVQQSRGWVHYAIHRPEPHILLFRRPLGTDPTTGLVVKR